MTDNFIKAFDSEDGFTIDGEIWFGGGSLDPTSFPPANNPPQGSFYFGVNNVQYRKFGINLADWEVLPTTDRHSGFYNIAAGKNVKIDTNKQMRVKGCMTLSGEVVVCGQLVVD